MTPDPQDVENAVLAVLAGAPLTEAATQVPIDPADLTDAVATYRAAGRAALKAPARGWIQVRIHFTNWDTAEQTAATQLGPRLQQAQEAGTLAGWWFLRKHPCWRLRCRPGPQVTTAETTAAIAPLLDSLVEEGTVQRWWETALYEPESLAFGGARGMDIAHDLFHADSHGVLTHLSAPTAPDQPAVGRKELAVLLCTSLFRGARQDSHEQGDIWHRVAQLRPLTTPPTTDQLHRMAPGLHRLTSLDTSPTGTLFAPAGPLPHAGPWAAAFTAAGRQLADAARGGTLQRGLRDVLANHVIFHFNRIGIPTPTQAVLARAARTTLLNLHEPAG